MSEKQTYCPNCLTKYKVTVAQLTVAKGMVCCAKCSTNFNALIHLVAQKAEPAKPESNAVMSITADYAQNNDSYENIFTDQEPPAKHLLDIFDRKVENSNIDLKTYLNNLNYFSKEPIGNYPALNWAEKSEQEKKHGLSYYILWSLVNIALISLLVFQFFWFNPRVLNNSPALSALFNSACQAVNCSFSDKNYRLISINKVKLKQISAQEVQFSGQLINYHSKSLALPIIRVNLKNKGQVTAVYSIRSSEYLVESLSRIQRIPQNSPFKFKFSLPVSRKSFDTYNLEIIRP